MKLLPELAAAVDREIWRSTIYVETLDGTEVARWTVPINGITRELGLSPDGKYVVAVTIRNVSVWEIRSKKLIFSSEMPEKFGPGHLITFYPDSKRFLVRNDVGAALFEIGKPEIVEVFEIPHRPVWDMRVSPDGKFLAMGFERNDAMGIYSLEKHKTVFIANEKFERLPNDEIRQVHCVRFSPDGKLVAALSLHQLAVYEVQTGKLVRRYFGLHEDLAYAFCWHPNGKSLCVENDEGLLTFLPIDEKQKVVSLDKSATSYHNGQLAFVRQMVISSDGKQLVVILDTDDHGILRFDLPAELRK